MPPADAIPDRTAAGPWNVVLAGGVAAVVSGVPSTLHALARGADPLEASLAAGTLLLPRERRQSRLLVAAAAVHATLSLGWAAVLAALLPRRRPYACATLAALGIAALDLGIIGWRFPRIRALPTLPQVADHLAYAWTVAAVLTRRRRPPGAEVGKRRLSTLLATRLVNPPVKWAVRRGLAPRSYAILETTGRRSGKPRRTPVGHVVEGDTVWIVAEHGHRAGYVRNIKANPPVRIKLRGGWRTGTARALADDDPRERLRRMGLRLNALVVRAMGTDLLTVRIDLDQPKL